MQKFLENRMLISVSLSIVLTFAFVFAVAYSSTTISTNITTAGTLTAPFASTTAITASGTASSTSLVVSGMTANSVFFAGTAGALSQDNTNLSWNDTTNLLTVTYASTTAITASGTASSTNMVVSLKLGVGSSTPTSEISVLGPATTTLYLHSDTDKVGGCIEIKGTNNTAYRMYATSSGPATWEAGACK